MHKAARFLKKVMSEKYGNGDNDSVERRDGRHHNRTKTKQMVSKSCFGKETEASIIGS
jgi:hypothetical protein